MWHSGDREGMETLQTPSSYVHHRQLIRVYFSYRYSRAVLCEALGSSVEVIIQRILLFPKIRFIKEILVLGFVYFIMQKHSTCLDDLLGMQVFFFSYSGISRLKLKVLWSIGVYRSIDLRKPRFTQIKEALISCDM